MRRLFFFGLGVAVLATSAHAQPALEQGFADALAVCERWVLDPASWADGPEPFIAATGLGDRIALVDQVGEDALPPLPLRTGNHYWRLASTEADYVLVVSDQIRMCHITGTSKADLQPAIEAVLGSGAVSGRWLRTGRQVQGNVVSSEYRSRLDPRLSVQVVRSARPGQPLSPVQVVANATYDSR